MAKAPDSVEQYPRKFGKYRILKPLAAGGMGAVYLAVTGSEGMEKLLAIKVVRPHLTDAEFVRRFEDEAKVVVRLDHGNLVQVFEVGDVDGQMYMAMEYVNGRDLRAVWNRCVEKKVAFPLDVVVQIMKDALRGLSYAHEYGGLDLVHRDISPPNLLVSFAGQTKVADFGLALSNLKMQKTAPGLVFGKVSYMAPEQARGDRVDSRADLYALGIIVWELLTGRRLFPSGDNQAQDLVERSKGPVVEPPSQACARVPPELDEVVLRALAPRSQDRYARASDMLKSLAEVQAALWPDLDTDRVSTFMHLLYGERIEAERIQLQNLVVRSRSLSDDAPTGRVKVTVSGTQQAPLLGGRYRLGRMLGEGAMGQVFEAEHVDIGRRVAIKVLHRAYANTEAAVERFRREARAATRIHHKAIVEVLDFGTTDDGRCYYVMELLSGAALADVIDAEAPLNLDRAIGLTQQMCQALEAAHDAGVIHRDLKPANILITHDDQGAEVVKILDFGIAKWVDTSLGGQPKITFGSVGTPRYMAPEQATGQAVDRRSDIYAIAVILYEMLTGKTPFGDGLPQELLARKLQRPPQDIVQYRPDLPSGLAATIMAALDKEPDRRPATASEFASKLARYQGAGIAPAPSAAPGPAPGGFQEDGWAEPSSVGVRNSFRLILPLSILSVSVVVALALWWWAPWRGSNGKAAPSHSSPSVASAGGARGVASNADGGAKQVEHHDDAGGEVRVSARRTPVDAGVAGATPSRVPPPRASPLDASVPARVAHQLPEPRARQVAATRKTATIPRAATRTVAREPARTAASSASPRPTASALLRQARAAISSGRYTQASALLARAQKLPGGRTRALSLRASMLLRRGRYREAIRVADRAVKAGGGVSARLIMARAYQRMGLYRSAAAQYRLILTRHPGHKAAKAGLAAVNRHL